MSPTNNAIINVKKTRNSVPESSPYLSYEAGLYSQFLAFEREKLLSGPMEEITEEQYNHQFEVLLPLKWGQRGGIEMFCSPEMFSGAYTMQYAHDPGSNKYYSKMVDSMDESTWIHHHLQEMRKQ